MIRMFAIYALLSLGGVKTQAAYEVLTGPVMICDTEKQIERFVALFDGDQQTAMRAVNAEENQPNACAMVDVSYVQGPGVGMARSVSYTFQIAPVVVVGINTTTGYASVRPAIFFTPVEIKEIAV